MHKNEHGISSIKNKILPPRKQAEVRNNWLLKRLETVMPMLMKEQNIDCWLVIGREFNEDPLMKTFFVRPGDSGGRLCILGFLLRDDGTVERISLYPPGGRFSPVYEGIWADKSVSQWETLNDFLLKRQPKNIGVNFSEKCAMSDGISATHLRLLKKALSGELKGRIVSAEDLAIRWLETRLPEEIAAYHGIAHIMQCIIGDIFSSEYIHPGITHTEDIEWMFYEQITDLGLVPNFSPDIDVQRVSDSASRLTNVIIQPGDLIHCDVGFEYLGLNTDYQRLAYVLHPYEKNVPEGLTAALKTGHFFQNIVRGQMKEGRTGNEVFFASMEEAKKAGINAMLYTHPIGSHLHGAGPIIGLYDKQEFVSGTGENRLYNNTCFSLELNIKQRVPEWNKDVFVYLEENISFTDNKAYFLNGRMEDIYLIR